jgi:hypothetical protein
VSAGVESVQEAGACRNYTVVNSCYTETFLPSAHSSLVDNYVDIAYYYYYLAAGAGGAALRGGGLALRPRRGILSCISFKNCLVQQKDKI